jgi:hypothetical protein
MRLVVTIACLSMLTGCERPPGISLIPTTVRAPSDDQMERLSVYSAFLARQVPKTKWLCCSGRRMEGLLIRKPITYPGYDRGFTEEQVFPQGRLIVHGGLGGTDRSYDLAADTLKNFYAESARTDDLFAEGQFTGPFIALRDGEDLNSRFQMEPCHPPKMCGLRLIAHDFPNSGGLWGFSHIGFSRDHLQALVFYSDVFWGETGVALLEKGTAGWSIVASTALSVS